MLGGIQRFLNRKFHNTKPENFAPNQSSLKATGDLQPQAQPESRYTIEISEAGVSCERPDGTVESVTWDDLQSVTVETTGDGPAGADIFWILAGTSSGCVVPQGAAGDFDLLERFQKLPGFDNNAVIEAMISADAGKFLCWKR